jgi:hypothetical protein
MKLRFVIDHVTRGFVTLVVYRYAGNFHLVSDCLQSQKRWCANA